MEKKWIDSVVSHITTSKQEAIKICNSIRIPSNQWWYIYSTNLNSTKITNEKATILNHNNEIIDKQLSYTITVMDSMKEILSRFLDIIEENFSLILIFGIFALVCICTTVK